MRSVLPLNHHLSSSTALYLGLPLENGKLELTLRRNAGAPISTSLVFRVLPPNTLGAFILGGKMLLPERIKNSSRPPAVPSHSPPRESQTKQSEKRKNSRTRSSRSPIWRREPRRMKERPGSMNVNGRFGVARWMATRLRVTVCVWRALLRDELTGVCQSTITE